ncbi:type VI secretion protein [Pseudomonas tolaasii]|nr:type VI secretion protein [Pseudomonas tolaasii]ARB29274.1 type VI secretion protein [Pseudomonas tolaasii]KAB0471004.1 type VI secretion protein [Pseudomonas tolaasii]WLH54418.1 type VI secretion protein [Pseudomonas tolaasii]
MPDHPWKAVVLVLCLLGGCSANYAFDDADYRRLGEPQSTVRGQ